MGLLSFLIILLFGLATGSFITAYSYRYTRGISIKVGRSFCDYCKKKLAWYDNVPLLSFVLLSGRCRECKRKISWRYPAIEISVAILFIAVFYFLKICEVVPAWSLFRGEIVCLYSQAMGLAALPFFLFIISALVAVFIIDLEIKEIPDELVYILLAVTFLVVLYSSTSFYINIFSAFASGLFLLSLHLLTSGRGMGLGDVKFALFAGMLIGWPHALTWMFLSFIIGAVVGLFLIYTKKAKFKNPIPFGPFLIISALITLAYGNQIIYYVSPFF